ncbi:MAG: PEP/pyruvate-binding domain-containing protein [Solirubrobacteraceae bacterium]
MAGAGASRELRELRGSDAGRYGGKSAALGELLAAGIPVPGGFALAADAFEEHVGELALGGAAAGADADADADADARAKIRAAPIAAAIADEIASRYAQLPGDQSPVAVRSSAIGEDSAQATFAGQQDTRLWVRGADAVRDAVRECWASLYNDEAVAYRRHLGAQAQRPAMGVAVQLMVDAAIAGVMFTCNPVTGDPSMVAVNAGWGLGTAVVGGEITPDDQLLSKVTGELVRETIGDKRIEYLPAADGHGTVSREVAPERRRARCLDGEALRELVALARRVEAHFGNHQDVEWAIDRAGALFVLQSRPVTGLPQRPAATPPASALSLVMSRFGAAGAPE